MSEALFAIEDGDVRAPADEIVVQEKNAIANGAVPTPEPVAVPAPVANPRPVFAFLGENKQGYLFVTDDAQSDYMSAEGMDAFTKTLGARKLSLDDVAVFNLGRHAGQVAFSDLTSFFKPRAVVLLGAKATALGVSDIAPNTVGQVEGIPVFQTYSFDVLLIDAGKKSVFWPVLKSLLV